mmetsp:Transcript_27102/g.46016  ORF Transcript_27102/g.46016 Transcript_27102/m.46016 type:complete len:115 (+) Transcript_27102:2-346(+)
MHEAVEGVQLKTLARQCSAHKFQMDALQYTLSMSIILSFVVILLDAYSPKGREPNTGSYSPRLLAGSMVGLANTLKLLHGLGQLQRPDNFLSTVDSSFYALGLQSHAEDYVENM